MKRLKAIRIVLATLFLGAATAYVCIGPEASALAPVAVQAQIVPSALGVTLGATLLWLTLTFLFGRVYCATACPVGTLLDCALWLRRRARPHSARRSWSAGPPFRYRRARRARWEILLAYIVCLVTGVGVVPMLIEPWHVFCNIAALTHPSEAAAPWVQLGISGLTGLLAGGITAVGIILSGLFWGRDFCTVVCPIGTTLAAATNYSFYHIEIDPDRCINCFECERNCPSSCIKVVSRFVDDTRCVRCMDCTARCPNDAIRLQLNRKRPATPLFIRHVTSTPSSSS